eukprot:TRINITY_DN1379_c1_g1_i4.p2 TRINITY_DN1379_c1_g1~~TRINITY_DN1379_c1_g1_i4.p2  ORF type:complete len:167 (+),score=12.94 TRINITY_DN1379_c1_g1_i4:144-644(+)
MDGGMGAARRRPRASAGTTDGSRATAASQEAVVVAPMVKEEGAGNSSYSDNAPDTGKPRTPTAQCAGAAACAASVGAATCPLVVCESWWWPWGVASGLFLAASGRHPARQTMSCLCWAAAGRCPTGRPPPATRRGVRHPPPDRAAATEGGRHSPPERAATACRPVR